MLDRANVPFEFKPISFPAWLVGGKKKTYGGLPFTVRKDGSIMKETDPIARYICRQCDLYPTAPLDAYWNDFIIMKYGTPFNQVHANLLVFGAEKKRTRALALSTVLPDYLTAMAPYYKEGWVVGDGSKFYMADIYIGTFWTDILNNPGSWIKPEERKVITDQFPDFVAYGKRFEVEMKSFLDKRAAIWKSAPEF
jgi:hypothetical protein